MDPALAPRKTSIENKNSFSFIETEPPTWIFVLHHDPRPSGRMQQAPVSSSKMCADTDTSRKC